MAYFLVNNNIMIFKKMRKAIVRLLTILVLISLSNCDEQRIEENGIISGTIKIGPICPVETLPPDPGCLPTAETYKSYPVYINSSDGFQKILINPKPDGSFSMELAPADYFLTLEKELNGPEHCNLPLVFTIYPSETTLIDIEIDTGIR